MGSRAAEKIFLRLQASVNKSGFMPQELKTLYTGFGFEYKEGGNHTTYRHPKYKRLITQVPRHKPVLPVYAKVAIDLIEQVKQLEAEEVNEEPGS